MMVLRRFVSKRGYPQKMISDAGLQPVAAGKEKGTIVHSWEWKTMRNFGEKGVWIGRQLNLQMLHWKMDAVIPLLDQQISV